MNQDEKFFWYSVEHECFTDVFKLINLEFVQKLRDDKGIIQHNQRRGRDGHKIKTKMLVLPFCMQKGQVY